MEYGICSKFLWSRTRFLVPPELDYTDTARADGCPDPVSSVPGTDFGYGPILVYFALLPGQLFDLGHIAVGGEANERN